MRKMVLLSLLMVFCSFEEGVEIVSLEHSDSCVVDVFKNSAKVDINVGPGVIHVIHHNAYLNCCLDDITLDIKMIGNIIEVYENEIVDEPCRCTCPFRVAFTIKVPSRGFYIMRIYTEGKLVYENGIFVP